jgi:nitrate/TMAO reductase-like tetraheme cytochrome c subunit
MRKFFRNIGNALHRFFFPPEGTKMWLRVLPYAILGVLTIIVLVGAAYGWQYTNSPEFCGTTCHTMPPEYTSYLSSPHARVDCTECHIGRGFIATQITRKAGDIRHITATLFHNYEYPIFANNMRRRVKPVNNVITRINSLTMLCVKISFMKATMTIPPTAFS